MYVAIRLAMTQRFLTWTFVRNVKVTLLLVVSIAALSAACGGSSLESVSPTGPSSLSTFSQSEATASTASSNARPSALHTLDGVSLDEEDSDVDNDEDSDLDDDEDSDGDSDLPGHTQLEVEGVVQSVPTGCPSGSFTIRLGTRDVTVRTNTGTVFHHGICGDLRVGARIEVKGRPALDRSSIDATRVNFEGAERGADVEIEGVVRTSISGCPTGTGVVGTGRRDVTVRVGAHTLFREGTCNDLRTVGRRVEVKGLRAIDGVSIEATRITFEDSDREDDEDSDD